MKNLIVFTLGAFFFIAFLLTPLIFLEDDSNIGNSFKYSALIFYGISATDLAQDIIGFRALVMDENAYPNLGVAHEEMGLNFPVDGQSTHLPTTFLFVAPVAFMPWRYASITWAIFMLVGIFIFFRMSGFPWPQAIGYGFLSILWLPIMMSFGQFTILWLVLLIMAYKMRNQESQISGFLIGLATLIKLFPAIMIIPFFLQKKWKAIYGFLIAIGMGVVSILLLSPQSIVAYLNTQQNIRSTIAWSDNSSLFSIASRYLGISGIIFVISLLCLFIFLNRATLRTKEQAIEAQSWAFWTYLSVILLPVIWIYSLVPLLPVILDFIKSQKTAVKIIGWLSILIPIFGHPWGDDSVPYIVGVTLLVGIGITITNRSFA